MNYLLSRENLNQKLDLAEEHLYTLDGGELEHEFYEQMLCTPRDYFVKGYINVTTKEIVDTMLDNMAIKEGEK